MEFLAARVSEDEQNPPRFFRANHRRRLATIRRTLTADWWRASRPALYTRHLRAFANRYKTHPDYRKEWYL